MSPSAIEKPQVVTASKAGRHRLYSNEQRKDRNRQAQAAFRDRRSKYQKTLETAMLKYEDTIEDLKRENARSMERVVEAEQRCHKLDTEVADLRKSLQMALAENQRLLSSYVASPGSPSYSVPEIHSPPPSTATVIPNYDFLFTSLDNSIQQNQLEAFPVQDTTTWLPYNQIIDHKYVFTDCNANEFCLDLFQEQELC